MRKLPLLFIAVALMAVLIPTTASAHHPEITASAVCSDSGLSLVTATAEAWANPDPPRRVNNLVSIDYWDGLGWVNVALGAFNASNNYTITTIANVQTSLGSVVFRATGVVNWGPNGEYGSAGDYREATVQLPTNCATPPGTIPTTTSPSPSPTTTPPATTTTLPAPTTTVGTTTVPTTLAVPPSTNPPVTGPDSRIIERERELARTDRHNEGILIFIAAALAFVGFAMLVAKPTE